MNIFHNTVFVVNKNQICDLLIQLNLYSSDKTTKESFSAILLTNLIVFWLVLLILCLYNFRHVYPCVTSPFPLLHFTVYK